MEAGGVGPEATRSEPQPAGPQASDPGAPIAPAAAPISAADPAPSPAPGAGADGDLIGRRRFIRLVLGFSLVSMAALVVTPIVGFLIPRKTEGAGAGGKTLAGTTTDIPAGTGKVVAMGSSPVIVVNGEGGVKAFSAVCTHLGCIVGYDSTSKQIICPCHDGHFNPISGAVISGPPPAPLKPIGVSVEKDQIFLVQG
jgi:nitrite reductase/ring-hydroxylating ferredoxin subunit